MEKHIIDDLLIKVACYVKVNDVCIIKNTLLKLVGTRRSTCVPLFTLSGSTLQNLLIPHRNKL
jgi:hypothetical protein